MVEYTTILCDGCKGAIGISACDIRDWDNIPKITKSKTNLRITLKFRAGSQITTLNDDGISFEPSRRIGENGDFCSTECVKNLKRTPKTESSIT